MRKVRVWDAPTRIVHWGLALAVPFAWGAAEYDNFVAHRAAGYVILGLLAFRLVWGFIGSDTARFSSFVRGPGTVVTYARSLPSRAVAAAYGHNPLGGWSVVAMLLALVMQVCLGLIAVDTDGMESGPLADLVSFETGRWASKLHHQLFNIILALIALHIAAVLFYALWKRRNLIAPMITGRMKSDEIEPGRFAPLWRAGAVALAAAALAWIVANPPLS